LRSRRRSVVKLLDRVLSVFLVLPSFVVVARELDGFGLSFALAFALGSGGRRARNLGGAAFDVDGGSGLGRRRANAGVRIDGAVAEEIVARILCGQSEISAKR
jgi:hypothetical protein